MADNDTYAPPLILVLGMVGVGKSTFISCARTKERAPTIHSSMEPPLGAVEEFELESNNGRTVSLVDTPGFNNTTSSDSTVLASIIEFLESKPDRKVGGIIYLLDASNRNGTQYTADKIQPPPPTIVLATVHPQHAGTPISKDVKSSLKSKYGATVYQEDHFGQSSESASDPDQYEAAWTIIHRVLDMNQGGVPVQSVIRCLTGILRNHTPAAGEEEIIEQGCFQRTFGWLICC